jgi:hypothetical protein
VGQLVGERGEIYIICPLLLVLQPFPSADLMPAGKKWVSWWVSRVSVCTADATSLQPLSCSDYDPRSWRDEECMWSAGFESLGEQCAVCHVILVVRSFKVATCALCSWKGEECMWGAGFESLGESAD